MTELMLELDDIHVSVGDLEILRGVTLNVRAGEAVGLVGETGSGKTMTVRAATGLLNGIGARVTSGSVRIDGAELATATDRQWRTVQGKVIALVPQSSMSSLNPLMPIGRQLMETIRRRRNADTSEDARLRYVLSAVQLEMSTRLLDSYPHELSGGMKQRVMIALALACDPQIIVADEPTTALDAAIRREILELLTTLRREHNVALLLISHDLSAISVATDRTVVMYGGATVEQGFTPDVVNLPRHPYTAALVASHPDRTPPGSRIPVIPGHPPAAGTLGAGCGFAPRCPIAIDQCWQTAPPLVHVDPSHSAACLRIDEVHAHELYKVGLVR